MASGTSSKAMKLLGLSKLPPDASRAEHLALIRQHRSVRLERAKSMSPLAVQQTSTSRLGSGVATSADGGSRDAGAASSSMPATPVTHRPSSLRSEHESSVSSGTGGGEFEEYDILNVRESSLKLTDADVDEEFMTEVAELMSQFPKPPSRALSVDATSPFESTAGRGKRSERRGLHQSKSLSSWRAASVGGAGDRRMQHSALYQQLEQQQQYDACLGHRGVHAIDSPARIRFQADDDFEL